MRFGIIIILILLTNYVLHAQDLIYQSQFDLINKSKVLEKNKSHVYSVIGTPDLIYVGDEASRKTWLGFLEQDILPQTLPGMLGLLSEWDYTEAAQFFIPNGMEKDSIYTIVFFGAIKRGLVERNATINLSFQSNRENDIKTIVSTEASSNIDFEIEDFEWRRYEQEVIMSENANRLTIRNAAKNSSYVLIDALQVYKGKAPIQEEKKSNASLLDTSVFVEIFFESDEFKISKRNREILDTYFESIDITNYHLNITGKTDLSGNAADNELLANRRCLAIIEYLQVSGKELDYKIDVEIGTENIETDYYLDRKVTISLR